MATFKVGQRVKKFARNEYDDADSAPVGAVGTVIRGLLWGRCENSPVSSWDYLVDFDGIVEPRECGPDVLAPLTDPKADAFIESIKRLKPYEEPKRINEKQHAE